MPSPTTDVVIVKTDVRIEVTHVLDAAVPSLMLRGCGHIRVTYSKVGQHVSRSVNELAKYSRWLRGVGGGRGVWWRGDGDTAVVVVVVVWW